MDYNYQLLFNHYNKLSFGIRFGAFQSSFNTSDINPFHTDDYLLNQNYQSRWNTNGHFGMRFTHQDFSTELVIPQLFASNRDRGLNNLIALSPYLYHRTLYTFHAKQIDLDIEPQYVVIKEKKMPISHQIGFHIIYKDFLQIYTDIRFKNSYKFGLGVQTDKGLYFGYNIQRYIQSNAVFRGLNQELMLAYRFSRKKKKTAQEMVNEFYRQPDELLKETDNWKYNRNEKLKVDSMSVDSMPSQHKDIMRVPNFEARVSNRDQVIEFLRFQSIVIEEFKAEQYAFSSFDREKIDFVLVLGIYENQRDAVQQMKTFNNRFIQTSMNEINQDYYVLLPVEKDISQRYLEEIWLLLESKETIYWMINY